MFDDQGNLWFVAIGSGWISYLTPDGARVPEVNCNSPHELGQTGAPHAQCAQCGTLPSPVDQMAQTGGGSTVNISSIMGFVGGASGHPADSASKGAVRIYMKSAAVRYGPRGIRVNSVHPGYMPPMLNATNANERGDKIALTPLRRLGEPIEVAYGVLFLASDEASFVTGAELVIDGGYIAQ